MRPKFYKNNITRILALSTLIGISCLKNEIIEEPIEEDAKKSEYVNRERLYETLKRHEGERFRVYDDKTSNPLRPGEEVRGNRTIGVGLNLDDVVGSELLKSLVGDFRYEEIYNGTNEISKEESDSLLSSYVDIAKEDAKSFLGDETYEEIDVRAREIVINMAFMGQRRLNGFRNLRDSLKMQDYQKAADDMKNSIWYGQTGIRGRELVEAMRDIE